MRCRHQYLIFWEKASLGITNHLVKVDQLYARRVNFSSQPTVRITFLGVTHIQRVQVHPWGVGVCEQNMPLRSNCVMIHKCSPVRQQLRARDAFVITQSVNSPAAQPDANEKLLSAGCKPHIAASESFRSRLAPTPCCVRRMLAVIFYLGEPRAIVWDHSGVQSFA